MRSNDLLTACYLLLATHCWLLAASCLLCAVCCLLFATHCLLLAKYYLLLAVSYLPLAIHYLLPLKPPTQLRTCAFYSLQNRCTCTGKLKRKFAQCMNASMRKIHSIHSRAFAKLLLETYIRNSQIVRLGLAKRVRFTVLCTALREVLVVSHW